METPIKKLKAYDRGRFWELQDTGIYITKCCEAELNIVEVGGCIAEISCLGCGMIV